MKASDLFCAGSGNDSLEVLWEDTERAFCRLRCDDSQADRHTFVPSAAHPTLDSINRLTHEYELKDHLDAAWALRPLDLVREHGRTILVVEYTGGEPLDRVIHQPMEIGRLLRLAVGLSAALGRLHGRGLI